MDNKEIRNYDIECRIEPESRTIKGVAIVFNSLSQDLGGFREKILPEAVEGVIENSDIFLLYNHQQERGFLARSRNGQGTLRSSVEKDGVHFEFEAPNTALGDEVLEHVRRGECTECSFAFTLAENGDIWEKNERGEYIRTITKFNRFYDYSICPNGAYNTTSVSCRSFEEFKEQERREIEEAQKAEEEKRQAEEQARIEEEEREKAEKLDAYYKDLKEKYLK